MDKINDWLYIGDYVDCITSASLQAHQIGAILQLSGPVNHPTITSLYIPITDGEAFEPAHIALGMDFVAEQRAQGKSILIACAAGISRSATFCMAALKEQEGLRLLEAYRLIKKKHPIAQPHAKLLQTLCQHYPQETSLETLMVAIHKVSQP